jgi:hypothetical protein
MTEVDFSALKCPPDITWTNTIKNLFTEEDVQHMIAQNGLNLADYSQVKAQSARIYAMVSTGRMPPSDCTSDPVVPWSSEMNMQFACWMHAGCPE